MTAKRWFQGRFPVLTLVLISTVGLWAGCGTGTLHMSLTEDLSVNRLTTTALRSPVDWHPAGTGLTFVRNGLVHHHLATGQETVLDRDIPTALAWAPDGLRLAAAFADRNGTEIRLLSAEGHLLRRMPIDGHVSRLLWDRHGALLTVALSTRSYSFGSHLKATLYRWDREESPTATRLYETSLKPRTLQSLGPLPSPALSPMGDELLFVRLHDPPAFAPYFKLVLRHLESGSERVLGRTFLTSGGGRYLDDDRILYGDGRTVTRELSPWGDSAEKTYPRAGQHLAVSAGGHTLFIDGTIQHNGVPVATLSGVTDPVFSPTGDRLLFQSEGNLYLLRGLPPDPPLILPPAATDKVRQLRLWRSRNLLSPTDYFQQKKKAIMR